MCHCLTQSEAVSRILLLFLQKSKINQMYWEEIKSEIMNRKIRGIITAAMEDLCPEDCSDFVTRLRSTDYATLWMAELDLLWRLQFIYPLVMLSPSDPELFLSIIWVFFLFNVFPPFGFDSLWKIRVLKYSAIVNVIFCKPYHSQVGLEMKLLVCKLHYCKVCLQMLRGKQEKQRYRCQGLEMLMPLGKGQEKVVFLFFLFHRTCFEMEYLKIKLSLINSGLWILWRVRTPRSADILPLS